MRFRLITYNIHKGIGGVDRQLRFFAAPDQGDLTIAQRHVRTSPDADEGIATDLNALLDAFEQEGRAAALQLQKGRNRGFEIGGDPDL